jgi:ubiquinone/menaquinone biosynthesis C-methylase UbiE
MTANAQRDYLPAAGIDAFLPFYDLTTKLMGADRARRELLDQAALKSGQHVLDIGCGTGTLAILLKRRFPRIEIIGLDPDPKALTRAKAKARRDGVFPQFELGFSDSLAYPAESFDHVFSSFMFHHLDSETKERTLREIRRVLRPGGQLHLLDFVASEGRGGFLAHLFHSHAHMAENSDANILALLNKAELADARVAGRRKTLFGLAPVAYYSATAPEAAISGGASPAASSAR